MNSNNRLNEIEYEEWESRLEKSFVKQADMNRLILNYLVTEGYKEAAEKFQVEADLESSTEFKSLDARMLIREAVQCGHIEEAVYMVNQLHPQLFVNNPYLLFRLQQLQLIELIRANKDEESISFAQNHLSKTAETIPEILPEIGRTLALLAFEKPEESPFAELLERSHCIQLASDLNTEILKCEPGEQSTSNVMFLLKLILWAQNKLDGYGTIHYPRMNNLANAHIEHK